MIEHIIGTVTPRTLDCYTKSWREYLAFCEDGNLDALRPASLLAWRTSLVEAGYGPNTINSTLSAIKSIFRAGCAAGELSIEAYTQVRAIGSVSVRALRDRLRPAKEVLSDAKVQRILGSIDTTTPKGLRDKAIITTLATTGVRIEELSSLTLTSWSAVDKIILVMGKTDSTPRAVPLADVAARAITRWLYARNLQSDWIFTSFAGKSGISVDKPITTQGAYNAVVAACKAAGVDVTPHDFRRYVATILANRNIVTAQAMLGHASIITTQRYVKRADLPAVDWLG